MNAVPDNCSAYKPYLEKVISWTIAVESECENVELPDVLNTCCRKWKWKFSNAHGTCIAEGCFVLQAEPQGIVDHRKQIHFQSQTGIWKRFYENSTWKLSMVAFDYKCFTSILNFTFWSTRANELMEPFPAQSQRQRHHLSSSAPRSVTLEVILGGKLARLAGRLPGASGRQSSPGGFAFYFHKNLNLSQFQSRPVTFIYINSNLQTCSDSEQECWKRKKAYSSHGGFTTISINVSSS